jgi:hypothetical protein
VTRAGPLASLALALALLGGAAGCANNALFASAGDYSAYRATRVARSFEARLAAAQRYLKERPDGVFHEAVRAYFDPAEEVFYASKKDSRPGLEAYLAALPQGPHKDEATRRIGQLDVADRSRRAELDKTVATVEARVSGPGATARARVRSELEEWLGRFLDAGVFHAPLSRSRATLIVPFSLSLPSPHCSLDPAEAPAPSAPRRCAKLLELAYDVEGPRGPDPREATLEITVLERADGTPVEVTLGGPDLFLRLEETYRVKPIAPDDAEQRAAANARAVTFVSRVFSNAVSEAGPCAQPVLPPLTLRLACEGVRVDVRPAASPGEDDRIVIAPSRSR